MLLGWQATDLCKPTRPSRHPGSTFWIQPLHQIVQVPEAELFPLSKGQKETSTFLLQGSRFPWPFLYLRSSPLFRDPLGDTQPTPRLTWPLGTVRYTTSPC